jgi:1-phosphofructokinase family hexose kinase
MILCVTLNPCVDRTLFVEKLDLDKIISARRTKCIPGGKGNNVARVLKTFGADCDSFVLLGGNTGKMVEDMLRRQDGITPIAFWTQAATREVVTVVEEGTHRQVAFKEPGPEITPTERKGLMALLRNLVGRYEWVVFSGTVPCPALDEIYFELVVAARAAGAKAVLDSSGPALIRGLRAGPFLAKLNLDEAASTLGHSLTSEADIWRDLSQLRGLPKRAKAGAEPIPIVVVTAGKQGAFAASDTERWRAFPPPVQTVNPVGSGDSFVGGMIAGLARGDSVEQSIRLGMGAGAANAAVWDAATFTMNDVERLLPQVTLQRLSNQYGERNPPRVTGH